VLGCREGEGVGIDEGTFVMDGKKLTVGENVGENVGGWVGTDAFFTFMPFFPFLTICLPFALPF
jgi:hypothetical protein